MEKKLFLFDAYALIYRAYYAFINNPRKNSKGLNTSAVFGFANTILDVLFNEKPTHCAVIFDPPGPTFRHDMFEAYKANRPPAPEEIKLSVPYIKSFIEALNIPVLEREGYEADDVIGTLAKQAEKQGFTVFMMTPDKDFAQLITENIYMYKPARSGNLAEVINLEKLPDFFGVASPEQVKDVLALWGDASDNIPGVQGIGEKTARKLIAEYGSLDILLQNTNQLKGKIKENLESSLVQLQQSRELVEICLNVPIEFNAENCLFGKANKEKITELFEELEFRTMLPRINPLFGEGSPVAQPTASKPQSLQYSLFGDEDFTNQPAAEIPRNTLETVEHKYLSADTEEKIDLLIKQMLQQKEICFDTETTNIDANYADLVGLSFAWKEHEAWWIPVPENRTQTLIILEKLKLVLENPSIKKIGQNIKYDILVLKWYGIELKGELFDTMMAHYLLHPELVHNLNYLAKNYLNYQPVTIESLIGKKTDGQISMRNVSAEKICDYACEDADITLQLKNLFEKEIQKEGLGDLLNQIEMPLVYVLAEMEKTGVKINSNYLDEYAVELRKEIIEVEKEIFETAGMEFNISSPKQLGEVLFDRLKIDNDAKKLKKSGQYSTGEDVLVKFKDKHPIIEKILDYRSLKKLLSTYVESLPKLVNPKSGKIHTSFNQAVTTTGRLSSNNPNLQNIPIREARGREIRKAFIPSPGNVFFSADYSQVELRLMAHLSQDPSMIEAFRNNEDIHTATAAKINKIKPEEVTREMRANAKSANFGIIYGISAFGLAQNLNISRSESKNLIDNYFATYPKVKEYMDSSIAKARDNGFVETIFKRKRTLPMINSRNPMVKGIDERNAINAPIQGSAADIIKIAMNKIHARLEEEKLQSKMILQVHDELNFDANPNELEILKKIVVEEMQNAVKLDVPLVVDFGVGDNWMEAH
ncbi:MAG: DNA polymerase I [Bacteroidales bacterium]|nr:DNA polymerase I [Bacteroidales bacterium]